VLVDDVITTGATMRECGRACYAAGASSVTGIACAAGLGRDSEEETSAQKRR
jgi:predicted amidophosphoribosyltransferase